MRRRWAWALLSATIAVTALVGASAARAADPVQLGAGYVLDEAGALSASAAADAQSRLEELYAQTGADLYVVFVDTFENPADSESWANTVAEQNGLGPAQYLLAIAVDARQYYLSADSAGPLTQEQVAGIEADILPPLRDDDYQGAVITAADSMQAALGGTADPGPGESAGGGFPLGTLLLIVLVVGAVIAVIVVVVRSRRRKDSSVVSAAGADTAPLSTADLRRQAASDLIATDDALKTSEQELGFARAQFGDEATSEFVQALATARAELDEAFSLQQKLDDEVPDSEEQIRQWNARIIELCAQANDRLDERAAEFDELRRLEQDAPEALARLQDARAAAAAAVPAAASRLTALAAEYAPEAIATISDNPAQAASRLEFADEELGDAAAAVSQGDGGEAAIAIRAAEEALGQVGLLTAAIEKTATDLRTAEQGAAALIAELEQDIAAAAALPDSDGRVAAAGAAARQQIDAARAALSAPRNPLAALQGLEAANAQIDELIQGVRDAQLQAQRAQSMLAQVMTQAQARVSAVEDFITARRGAVGAQARTRLAEAGASLVRAQQLQQSDPQQALAQAQRADQLAAQAIQAAQQDVSGFGGAGMRLGAGPGGGAGGGLMGAVLGGIVLNSALGGGRASAGSRGGFGSLSGGAMGSRGGGRGRVSPGSFGGGGTRARRGGGRF